MSAHTESIEPADLIFLEPVFHTRVWGGGRLRYLYGYDAPPERVGEMLALSARPDSDSIVRDGRFAGMTLSSLWAEHPALFGGVCGDEFPLRIKILDAAADLSVQVHPTATYAARHDADSEKNECWYVMSASWENRVVLGHHAQTADEFTRLAAENRWDKLLRSVDMRDRDFFHVPAGTVHALLAGSLVYEVQQSSDSTYRLHDYDRLDNGRPRELHTEKALAVLGAPSRPNRSIPFVTRSGAATRYEYARGSHFALSRWVVTSQTLIPVDAPFLVVGVLHGIGSINGVHVRGGEHFIAPASVDALRVSGNVELMITTV